MSTAPWRRRPIVHVYVRSFADASGDGHGDLRGLLDRLDHLLALSPGAVLLSPIHPSPDADWGYDVSDYCGVHPDLGTTEDVVELVERLREHDVRLLLDLVANHTSIEHPWFTEHPERYVWADGNGGPPNNWVSMFGGPAWSLHEPSGRWYLHNFTPGQPDLDWWSPDVRAAFDEVLVHWLELGVGGFRVDVAHGLVKDRLLRDNPPSTDEDRPSIRARGQRPEFNMRRPEVHELHAHWRRLADLHGALLVGETGVYDLDELAAFSGPDGLHLHLNFPFSVTEAHAAPLREAAEKSLAALAGRGTPCWFVSSHDGQRLATRAGDQDRALALTALQVCLPGVPVLFCGDELGLHDVPVSPEQARDPLAAGLLRGKPSRDPARTPIPWTVDAPNHGFCPPDAQPWLPLTPQPADPADAQAADPGSHLSAVRALLALRAQEQDLWDPKVPLTWLEPAGADQLAFARGALTVELAFGRTPLPAPAGAPLWTSTRARISGP